jgi:Cdc6-like AAA superfamily ATPase
MYSLQKINNQEVIPIIVDEMKPYEIKGYDVIPMLYSNIFIVGMRGSGKTTSLFHIMKECIGKDTVVIVFSHTHNNDSTWIEIKKWLEQHNITSAFYDSIMDEDKQSRIQILLSVLKKQAAEHEAMVKAKEEQKKKNQKITSERCRMRLTDANNDIIEEEMEKIQKPAINACKYMLIFDDISSELRKGKTGDSIAELLKEHRHYKSKVIVSTQDTVDLAPGTKNQASIWLVYKGFGFERFKDHIYSFLNMRIPVEELYKIYIDVTKEQGSFLFINKINGELRRNFNEKIILNNYK